MTEPRDPYPPPEDRDGGDSHDPDDLDGFETPMSRLARHGRVWIAVVVVVAMVIPLGGWLLGELDFRRSADEVASEVSDVPGLAQAVMLVRNVGCGGSATSGSAFVLEVDGRTLVVTNRHVVEDTRVTGVRPLTGGTAIAVTGYRLSPSADVAVLEIAEPGRLPAALELGGEVAVGDPVRLVGFPAAMPFTTRGSVAASDTRRLLLDIEVSPGASGSPVVDAAGRVVGQIFARTGPERGVATAAAALRAAIADATPAEGC